MRCFFLLFYYAVLIASSPRSSSSSHGFLFPARNPPAQHSTTSRRLSSTTPSEATVVVDDDSSTTYSKQCVIVGGGPVGLAAALTLSNAPHYYQVTVLEQSELVTQYDPTRAYLYNVNPRGLQWATHCYPDALSLLQERGASGSMQQILYVPADPNEPVPPMRNVQISETVKVPPQRRSYWIPRHEMVCLLRECCMKQVNKTSAAAATPGSIQILYGKQFTALTVEDEDESLRVSCADGSNYQAQLVVGADGLDSPVRDVLANKTATTNVAWLTDRPKSFVVKQYKSPSTGLRMKSLQFPPNFTIPNISNDDVITTEPENMYVLRSVNTGTRNYVSLGFLPMKNGNLIRPGNINTRHNHDIWTQCTTGPAAKEFFTKAFPRLDWEAIVDNDAEWERFATATGTQYPYCQYSPGSAAWSSSDNKLGVVLVGDACHAFPPDIGQGINAGLQDVLTLDRALKGQDLITGAEQEGRKPSLSQALQTYQANRGPEHKALIQLARCGAPYQYKQSWRRDRIGRMIWLLNVAFRQLLNKLTFGVIPPAAIVIAAQNQELTYRQVMRRAHFAARGLKLGLYVVLLLLWRSKGWSTAWIPLV